jgi:hypothetical protein
VLHRQSAFLLGIGSPWSTGWRMTPLLMTTLRFSNTHRPLRVSLERYIKSERISRLWLRNGSQRVLFRFSCQSFLQALSQLGSIKSFQKEKKGLECWTR